MKHIFALRLYTRGTDANEIVVAAAKPLRDNAGPAEHDFVDAFNAQMLSLFRASRPHRHGSCRR